MNKFIDPPGIVQQIKQSLFICVACGAGRDCDCDAPAAKRARVAEYDRANPGRSERQAAADLNLPKTTVHEARGRTRPPDDPPPSSATVTGRDGKSYPATKPKESPMMSTGVEEAARQAGYALSSDVYKLRVRMFSLAATLRPMDRRQFIRATDEDLASFRRKFGPTAESQ
jgi:hypothetical protein